MSKKSAKSATAEATTEAAVTGKAALGLKRQCNNCGTKFYDLMRSPIVCPKCETVYQVAASTSRVRPEAAAVAARTNVAEGDELGAEEGLDLVPLEEIAAAEGDDKDILLEDDIDLGDDEDDTFLPDDEDEDEDVTDLIDGDIVEDDEN